MLTVFALWVVLTGLVTGALLVKRWDFYARGEIVEMGDTAVNALQIANAREGREIWGNYSRWGFHHPGPAFFYVYALGEVVLHEWAVVVRTPHGAHSIAGVALQSGFFVAGILILARGWRRRVFVPLGLAAGLAFFRFSDSAFFSVWPPHVLLMPYFAFFAACAAVAAGNSRAVPLAVLAGSFLVHGHVAHPLLVVPLFLVAWWLPVRRGAARQEVNKPAGEGAWWIRAIRRDRRSHAVAAAVFAVAVVPFVIDLTRGGESNFLAIFRHLRAHGSDWRSPFESVLFLLSYVGWREDAFVEAATWRERFALVGAGWAWLAPLAGVGGVAIWRWRRRRGLRANGGTPGDAERFEAVLGVVLVVALGLSLFWAVTQAGRHESFNSYYFHAVVLHVFLLGVGWVSGWAERIANPVTLAVGVALAVAFVPARVGRMEIGAEDEGVAVRRDVARVLAARADDGRVNLLSFRHRDWPQAAGVAVQLRRAGRRFAVSREWDFMFGPGATRVSLREDLAGGELAFWRLMSPEEAAAAGVAVQPLGPVRLEERPLEIDPNRETVFAFDGTVSALPFWGIGFSDPVKEGLWTTAREAAIVWGSSRAAERAVDLVVEAAPLLDRKRGITRQRGVLYVNGERIGAEDLTEASVARFTIPAAVWNARTPVALVLEFTDARSPAELGRSGDWRVIAWRIPRITVGPVGRGE